MPPDRCVITGFKADDELRGRGARKTGEEALQVRRTQLAPSATAMGVQGEAQSFGHRAPLIRIRAARRTVTPASVSLTGNPRGQMRLLPLVFAAWTGCIPADGGDKSPVTGTDSTHPTNDVDEDGDGYAADDDCDDNDSAVNPGVVEVCDGVDNDCDGDADSDATDAAVWYLDGDADGYGSEETLACDKPTGASSEGGDCNDADATISPAATETCNGVDDNCDGSVDEGQSPATWYTDADGDGYGDATASVEACSAPSGSVADGADCDDSNPAIHPGAEEADCTDPTDYNCDGSVGYSDVDADGHPACADCDDTDAAVSPSAAEVCDAADRDEDCDTLTDDADDSVDPASMSTWYADADADGYGDTASSGCDASPGSVALGGDCDDNDSSYNPGATETDCADPNDYNCDGSVGYSDVDGDGHPACSDCDDNDATISPGGTEVCDDADRDEDCDTFVDDADDSVAATSMATWYVDGDGDGYGDVAVTACAAPSDAVELGGDCDDSDPAYNPAADESDCSDPNDYNCDGSSAYADADGDGFAACNECDDGDASIHPDAEERCNGVDDNCDGTADEDTAVDAATWFLDADEDGYGAADAPVLACEAPAGATADALDCDDLRAEVSPAAIETCNFIDDDCDGETDENDASDAPTWYTDLDGDGYGDGSESQLACVAPAGTVADSTDCDDADAAFHPDADESDCTDPMDYNCDGSTAFADADADGFPACLDCDDSNPERNPDAEERCNGIDDDCDSELDEADAVDPSTWYADADSDGFGDADVEILACDLPEGATANSLDCDDSTSAVSPDALELCNGVDDNCDGEIDESSALDALTWYSDEDGDGFGDPAAVAVACTAPDGMIADATDCDDGDSAVSPVAAEVCNGIDDDCDGDADTGAVDATTWYLDGDQDGATGTTSAVNCSSPGADYATDAPTDCDDSDATAYPGAEEYCDSVDDDCDTVVDNDPVDGLDWVPDADGDGYGDDYGDTVIACTAPAEYVAGSGDCDDSDPDISPDATEICNGADDDCDGSTDDLGTGPIFAGSEDAGVALRYQYSPVNSGLGYIRANWEDLGGEYQVAVGSTPGDDDVGAWTDVSGTSASIGGLSLSGAWEGDVYYVSIRAANDGYGCPVGASSDVVQIAEAEVWDGDIADLRDDDAWGGATPNWPETGLDAVYGAHYFEDVNIAAGTTVYVQGFGRADAVGEAVSSSALAVTDPADGWVALYANEIYVAGEIVGSGRGYGGGGGGGGGSATTSYRGRGGTLGLGGAGGVSFPAYAGAGGGGSPGGAGGVGATTGGAGNRYGGGSGSTGCGGSNGRAGGDGSVGTIGGTGGTASSGAPGAAGTGEYAAGGGRGVSGCDNWSGGGGGGYGGGGGGGAQWASGGADASGGGGGGTGGVGGSDTATGGAGAGAYGGAGGGTSSRTGVVGTAGGYAGAASNADSSTDRSFLLGGGGGGGGGGYQESGGGGGGAGGGAIRLYAWDGLVVSSTASLRVNGAGGGGGAYDSGGSSRSAAGGVGAGGSIVLEGRVLQVDTTYPLLSALGGGSGTTNGGTIKLFYDTLVGPAPAGSVAGRVYDAGADSWEEP